MCTVVQTTLTFVTITAAIPLVTNDWTDISIYLLTAIGLTPGGNSTVHIYTQTIHRTTQLTQTIHRTT